MLGNILVVAALLSALYSLFMYYKAYKGFETIGKARLGYHITTVIVIFASVLLLYLILTHQYQYKYVYEYSSSNLTTGLLISSFFGVASLKKSASAIISFLNNKGLSCLFTIFKSIELTLP